MIEYWRQPRKLTMAMLFSATTTTEKEFDFERMFNNEQTGAIDDGAADDTYAWGWEFGWR